MIYRAVTRAAGPLADLAGPLAGADWRERLALDDEALHPPGGVWLHGASVGELTSARGVARALGRDLPLVVTANTATGRNLAADWCRDGWAAEARLAPLDLPGAVERFLDLFAPSVIVTVENEIWPNRAAAARARGIAQVVVGARMSARSAARWGRARRLVGPVLGGIDALSAQDAGSEARLVALGLRPEALMPPLQLKLIDPAATLAPDPNAARDATFLAASTHPGEDEVVVDAFLRARQAAPDLRLILAPRHPRRADEVAALVRARGLTLSRRSAGQDAVGPGGVLLVDVLGEMARWYAAAGVCLTGGSLVDHGGHTPWEPAGHGCAILHGPHVGNAADDYAALDAAGAALAVAPGDLGAAVARLAGDPGRARDMGARARALLRDRAGDPAALVARILDLAHPSG